MLWNSIRAVSERVDDGIARLAVRRGEDGDALVVFVVHALVPNGTSLRDALLPSQVLSVKSLRTLIEYFLKRGYRFSGAEELEGGVIGGRHAVLTFDDGYYNNVHALPVLAEYGVPSTFFISTSYVRSGRCFWWNGLYREISRRGGGIEDVRRHRRALEGLPLDSIWSALRAEFVDRVTAPSGDIDRPFTEAELRDVGRQEGVTLGNHTADHVTLTALGEAEARRQIQTAQADLAAIAGRPPRCIAYPSGGVSALERLSAEAGLRVGFGVVSKRNRLPLPPTSPRLQNLGRFSAVDRTLSTGLARASWDRRFSVARLLSRAAGGRDAVDLP